MDDPELLIGTFPDPDMTAEEQTALLEAGIEECARCGWLFETETLNENAARVCPNCYDETSDD